MEDLTKTQIVLLCLLVSFVTSIGTGIISFSLLSEAPQTVTQTINKVVERTIETVVPTVVPGEKTIEKEVTTVVVKEEDMIVGAIAESSVSVVRIYIASATSTDTGVSASDTFLGLGVIISADGVVVSDASVSDDEELVAMLSTGYVAKLTKKQSGSSELAVFEIVKEKNIPKLTPVSVGDSNKLALGQTVISISGKDQTSVAVGRVTSFKKGTGVDAQNVTSIETDISPKDSFVGGPLINLSGELVGITTLGATGSTAPPFFPSNLISQALSQQTNSATN